MGAAASGIEESYPSEAVEANVERAVQHAGEVGFKAFFRLLNGQKKDLSGGVEVITPFIEMVIDALVDDLLDYDKDEDSELTFQRFIVEEPNPIDRIDLGPSLEYYNEIVPADLYAFDWEKGNGITTLRSFLNQEPRYDDAPSVARLIIKRFKVLPSDELDVIMHIAITKTTTSEKDREQKDRGPVAFELVMVLLDNGADPDDDALRIAIKWGSGRVVDVLLESGLLEDVEDPVDVVHTAIFHNRGAILSKLVAADYDWINDLITDPGQVLSRSFTELSTLVDSLQDHWSRERIEDFLHRSIDELERRGDPSSAKFLTEMYL